MTVLPQPERQTGASYIFCDESGGSDAANSVFLVSAIAILPADAQRLIKSFRKATGHAGEVKGHRLASPARAIVFDLLARQAEIAASVVICRRSDPIGGWAMGCLPEIDLYGHLLSEACLAIPCLDRALHVTVTPDGGRYKKFHLDPLRRRVAEAVSAGCPRAKIGLSFGDSAAHSGVQIADVIAHTVFQSLGHTPAAQTARNQLALLVARQSLHIHPIRLDGVRPTWLVGG
jgi:hypothetical protein